MFQPFSTKLAEKLPANANKSARWLKARTEPNSSTAKSTPPMGAPKAVETPAAAPTHDTSCKGTTSATRVKRPDRLHNKCAKHTPMWMHGPSLPTDMPPPTTNANPTDFISKHGAEKHEAFAKPPTAAFTSGIPLPFAGGAKEANKSAATAEKPTVAAMFTKAGALKTSSHGHQSTASPSSAKPAALASACLQRPVVWSTFSRPPQQ
mmetsp:Transcript_129120/g.373721  ORF Transcript_129120/g.373721 Transcript_129120/m.373721 type:complete len:207 (+) Transcript_129120:810-1430(+)